MGTTKISNIHILFIGDVVGKLGRTVLREVLPQWKQEYAPDLVIANVENVSHGKGVMIKHLTELKELGIDVFTGGNHVWSKENPQDETIASIAPFALPANDPQTTAPSRYQVVTVNDVPVTIINLLGTFEMYNEAVTSPFKTFDELFTALHEPKHVFVDLHAEATSEKNAFGFYVDGRASTVVGTHTHIPTADERILAGGTGYISDCGMTGSNDSVLGVAKEVIIKRFLEEEKISFEYPDSGPAWINGVFCELDANTGRCVTMKRLQKTLTIN
jgi:2',3'-cyclic-nucleotide 2'-phosphodiesterase